MHYRLAICLLATCLSGSALAAKKPTPPAVWTQEPDSFMGIRFDKKLEYSIPLCPSGYELPKEMCREAPYQNLYVIQGAPSIGLVGGYQLSAMAKNSAVDSFYLTTSTEDFSRLAEVFIAKYGQPTKKSLETVKTKGGGSFANESLEWQGKNVEIILQKFDGDINTSSATIRTVSSITRSIKDGDDKVQSAASKL